MMDHLNIEHNTCSVCSKIYFNSQAFKSHIEMHLRDNHASKRELSPTRLAFSSQGLEDKDSLMKQEYASLRDFDVF